MRGFRFFQVALFSLFVFLLFLPLQAQEEELEKLLGMNISDLLEIDVTSASKRAQKIAEVPATVHVISAQQIRENGYFTLDEALADLPGFQFRNIQGFNSYSFLRGVPNQNNLILVMVDGIQINELNSGGFYGGAQYNLDNVERIEVVYGPASALYGTNAISGIINIITRDPRSSPNLEAGLLYGTFDTAGVHIGYGTYDEKKQLGFRLSGLYKTSEKADLTGAAGDNNWTDRMENFEDDYSFDAKVVYKKITFGLTYHNKKASRSSNYKSVGTDYSDSGTLWDILFINSYIKHDARLSEKLDLNSQLYYRQATVRDNTIAYIRNSGQVGYYRPNNLIGVEGMFTYRPGARLTLIGGVVYESENLARGFSKSYSSSKDSKPEAPAKPQMLNNNLISLFVQGQYDLVKGLQLTAGARYDNSDYYGEVLTPRMAMVYNYKKFIGKVLYTEAFRAPKPWDYTSGIGNPDLKPEEMKSVEIASGYSLTNHLFLDLTYYRNRLIQALVRETVPGGYYWANSGRLDTDGLETGLEYRKGKLSSYINYTYCLSEDLDGNVVPEIGKHNANIGFTLSLNKNVRINVRGNYIGRRENPKPVTATGSTTIDSAFVVHSSLSLLDWKHFDLHLIIRNLFNEEYYHTSNRPPDRYRQPQRTLLLKVVRRF